MAPSSYEEAMEPVGNERAIPVLPDFKLKKPLNSRTDTQTPTGPLAKETIYLLYIGWKYPTDGGTYLTRHEIIAILNIFLRLDLKLHREGLFQTFENPKDELTLQIQTNLNPHLVADLMGRWNRWAGFYCTQNPEVQRRWAFFFHYQERPSPHVFEPRMTLDNRPLERYEVGIHRIIARNYAPEPDIDDTAILGGFYQLDSLSKDMRRRISDLTEKFQDDNHKATKAVTKFLRENARERVWFESKAADMVERSRVVPTQSTITTEMGSLSVSALAPSQYRPIDPYTSSEPEPTASDEAHASGRAPVIQRAPPMSYTDPPRGLGQSQAPSDSSRQISQGKESRSSAPKDTRPSGSEQSRQEGSSRKETKRKNPGRSPNQPEPTKRRDTGAPQLKKKKSIAESLGINPEDPAPPAPGRLPPPKPLPKDYGPPPPPPGKDGRRGGRR